MRINFIGLFKRSAYPNIYIYNLVYYLSRHIYPYLTVDANRNDVIILFDHYLQAYSKPYTIYISAGLDFTSQTLYMYF